MQHPPKKELRRPRRRVWLIALGAGVALAALGLCLLPAIQARFPASTMLAAPEARVMRTLYLGDAAALDSVAVSQTDGDSYTLRMQEGALCLERGGELAAVSETLQSKLIEAFTQVVVQETVTEDAAALAEHLGDMSLDPPLATARVRYRDGSEITLELGGSVPHTTYSYYRWSGDEGIYMCDDGIAEALLTPEALLLPVEQVRLYDSLIERASFERADGAFAASFAADGEGHFSGRLTSPYRYPIAPEQTEELLAALANFRLGTLEGPADADSRAAYGLDDPLLTFTLYQRAGTVGEVDENGRLTSVQVEAGVYTFVIGRAEGDFFYTCEYAGNCYLVSRFLLGSILSASPETLAARSPADMGGAALGEVLIEAPQGTLRLTAEYNQRVLPNNDLETDENGDPVYDIAVSVNGETADAEILTTLTTRLNALTASGSLPSGWAVPQGEEPRWRIVLTTAGGTQREIAGYRLDAFSDALAVDGVALHYVHEEAVDLVLADLLD